MYATTAELIFFFFLNKDFKNRLKMSDFQGIQITRDIAMNSGRKDGKGFYVVRESKVKATCSCINLA